MEIEVPVESSFHVKEGRHKAVLTAVSDVEAKDKKGNVQTKVRLLFEVFPEGADPGVAYLAAKNYEKKLGRDSELRQQIDQWQGPDCIKQVGRKFDPESLKGKEAIIEIVHVRSPKHEYPFCNITQLLPPPVETPSNN